MTTKDQRIVLLFDGDCAFCSAFARLGRRLPLRAEFKPLQAVDLNAIGVDPVRARSEVPSRRVDGTVDYGHHAIAVVLRTGTLPFQIIGRIMTWGPFNRLSAWCYRMISQHRHQISRARSSCGQAFVALAETRSTTNSNVE
jgi:predicted DCC family thiol-disulfide oxidoreductase YuxK